MEDLQWEKMKGLIPAVVQDNGTGRVLMLGYMNREALERTLQTGYVCFWSRSRNTLWTKGETSGHYLKLEEIRCDCDGDALLVLATPQGSTCHRGTRSCFSSDDQFAALEVLGDLERLVQQRRHSRPAGSYTTRLFSEGIQRIAKKVGEEAVELVVSAQEEKQRSVEEGADLLYHLLVFLAARELSLQDLLRELGKRYQR